MRLKELAGLFLKVGVIGFGGPAAHIALMQEEVVRKRQWLTQQQFLDLLGAANLIPGPTSTEMAISVGFVRAGWTGMCVSGGCFILPAALITGAFAWAYVRFGNLPQATAVLAGIKPAVIAVIALAVVRLGKAAARGLWLAGLGALALAAFLLDLNPLVILLGGGALGMVARMANSWRASGKALAAFPAWLVARQKIFSASVTGNVSAIAGQVAGGATLGSIALFFLKLGAVLYGGGYVLLAFLEQGLVQQRGWLTHQQLIDAIAVGQFTPGPVFSTATFIGYLLGGARGGLVATIGIFLPSFFYVALLAPVLFRLRDSPWMAAFLDSVNVCAVALMAGVTGKLGFDVLRGWRAWGIAVIALALVWRWKIHPGWVVLGGGIAGSALGMLR